MQMSPSNETLVDIPVNNNQVIIDDQTKYTWKSCCGRNVDRRVLLFSCQASISIMTLSLCMYMLIVHHDSCDSNQMYSNILMIIIGTWIPQPNMKK